SPVQLSTGESVATVRDLREKVTHLESDLKERHNQRNVLQRRLETLQERFESLVERNLALKNANASVLDDEEELLLPQETEENHPFRYLEFPGHFLERLSEFPHHVGRSAMAVLGRLAGGDHVAFSGAKRLKSVPSIMRQRIGIDFRLLFRLLPDRIQVIDLIPRQDLERKIKTLK